MVRRSDKVFQHLKLVQSASDTLVHYREELTIILETDAYDLGVGAVLLHHIPDIMVRSVAFASRTFLDRENNHSIINKEALTIIFELQSSTNMCMAENSPYAQFTSSWNIS